MTPAWMAYASTSEIEEHTSLTTAIRIIDDVSREQKAPLVKRAHEIRNAVKARVQRRNRQANQLAAE